MQSRRQANRDRTRNRRRGFAISVVSWFFERKVNLGLIDLRSHFCRPSKSGWPECPLFQDSLTGSCVARVREGVSCVACN